jgi:hypothetical protein
MAAKDINSHFPYPAGSFGRSPGLGLLPQAAGEFSAIARIGTIGPQANQTGLQEVGSGHGPLFVGGLFRPEAQTPNEIQDKVPALLRHLVQFVQNRLLVDPFPKHEDFSMMKLGLRPLHGTAPSSPHFIVASCEDNTGT